MLWPFGRYQPGDVVDVDQRIATVLTAEGFARRAGAPAPPPAAVSHSVSLVALQTYAVENGCSLAEARDRIAAERQAPPTGPLTSTQEAPSCA